MKFATVRMAAKELKVSESRLRRDAAAGKINHLMIGNRVTIDMDFAREFYPTPTGEGIGIKELSEITGLAQCAITRGAQEGWLPYWREGKRYLYDKDAVLEALIKRMREQMNEQQNES